LKISPKGNPEWYKALQSDLQNAKHPQPAATTTKNSKNGSKIFPVVVPDFIPAEKKQTHTINKSTQRKKN